MIELVKRGTIETVRSYMKGLSIRKYAQAHGLNRGSADHLQWKFFAAFAQALKERD